ncbi:hypothetical protein [Nonomuraea sp. NPDC050783]|uniref:hypothetical protein n=1 Tax=Nonomuraea sp. NPDC050783 TaxID=3154634 RepID=UPI003467A477
MTPRDPFLRFSVADAGALFLATLRQSAVLDSRIEPLNTVVVAPSWISSGGDMISTARDPHTFVTAPLGGELLPAELPAGYGLGVFVQPAPGGGTLISHNGGIAGARHPPPRGPS